MKKLFFYIFILGISVLFSGCSEKLVKVSPNTKNKWRILGNTYYQVYGAYDNKYKTKLQSVLKKMEKNINSKFKENTFNEERTNYTKEEIWDMCRNETIQIAGAVAKTSFERIIYKTCLMNHPRYSIYYSGKNISANLKSNNRLDIKLHYGLGKDNEEYARQSIRLIKSNNKIILVNIVSDNIRSNDMIYSYDTIMNFLKEEKIQQIPGDIELGFLENGAFDIAIEKY